jgi:hypothetical protein
MSIAQSKTYDEKYGNRKNDIIQISANSILFKGYSKGYSLIRKN